MILRRLSEHVRSQNWLAVFLDFLIVVTGVLIALWASQWAADRDARRSAQISQDAMDADLMLMAMGTLRRFTTNPCLIDSMRRLSEAVSIEDGADFTAPQSGRVGGQQDGYFADYYPVGLWNYPSQAFDRAVAVGAFDHMDPERAADYALAYEWVSQLRSANEAEERLRSHLSIVEMTDRMDESTRLSIRLTLAELDGWNQGVLNSGRFLFDAMHRLGIEPDEDDQARWRGYNAVARSVRGDCVIDLPLDFSGEAVGNRWSYEVEE